MFNRVFIVLVCAQAAHKFVHNTVLKWQAFAHYALNLLSSIFIKSYTLFYTTVYTLFYTHKFIHFLAVSLGFYTQYTGPTITTTLNN